MVSERERYAPGAEGAPPVPPAGGYRGRRRAFNPTVQQAAQQPVQPVHRTTEQFVAEYKAAAKAPTPAALDAAVRTWGTVAIAAAAVFAFALAIMLLGTRPPTFWETPMILIQLGVIGLGVYAATKPLARFRAMLALAMCALVNIATVSMLAMVLAAGR